MKLSRFIDHYFGGNRQAFRAATGVTYATVYRWLKIGASVHEGRVCLPVRDIVAVPPMAPDERRTEFEAAVMRMNPDANIERIGESYINTTTHAMWLGWCLAQAVADSEAVTLTR
ncbi:hypothetical protein GTB64_004549 [Salmonella enterica]|nr:hypothetical protein [Salmonella enterica]